AATRDIYFNRGNLNTNNQNVTVRQFVHQSGTTPAADLLARVLSLGSSQIDALRWNYAAGGTLNAGNSHITVSMGGGGTSSYSSFHSYPGHTYHHVTFTGETSTSNSPGTTFDTVTILGSHIFYANGAVYRILNLAPVKNYYFASHTTTTINEQLNYSTLDCTGFPLLTSATAG